ncbi:MAG TPA: DEAD/DEAH box helicase family protein, partial [Thermoanaerobaculia bacterium]|nr:DEAD/DEAH box helicase family protein [Thermoanaerobaculia bacterium]
MVSLYLKLDPKYSIELRNVWPLREVPASVRRTLNLPGPDEGIDLIGETQQGEFWAIQAKYRTDEDRPLTRKELSTFTDLAFSVCVGITFGLVCTNADRQSRKLEVYGLRLGFCAGDVWRNLSPDFFKRVQSHINGETRRLSPVKPRPHQLRAVHGAHRHFVEQSESRGKIVQPCGTGKTLTSYWVARELAARKVLIAVPSLALVRQTLDVWSREIVAQGEEASWICVCSDGSVSSGEGRDPGILMQDLGVRVHTDPDEIAAWLARPPGGIAVVLCTYQSGPRLAAASKKAGVVFDLGIMDEAHKTVGPKDSLFSHLLSDQNIKIKKRIFMTATERHYAGTSEAILSMDDESVYGQTFEMLSFMRALEVKPPILTDYKVVTLAVTHSEVADLISKNVLVKPEHARWDDTVEAETLASALALRKAMCERPIRHAVSYHSSIARAKAFRATQERINEVLPEYGGLETFHVSGHMPSSVRAWEISAFARSKRALITNARCLTEGVDIPVIDCVLFADPRGSTIDIVQAVGRALRPAPGKELGYVVVPVLLPSEGKSSSEVVRGAYDRVFMVLRALAANDERIVDYFRSVSGGRRPSADRTPVIMEVPVGVGISPAEFAESIELTYWSRLARLSWRPFEQAREFVRSLGLRSGTEWKLYCRDGLPGRRLRPRDIPTNPHIVYADAGWMSRGDWLGTGTVATFLREYRPFEDARALVRSLGLRDIKEWQAYCRGGLSEIGVPKPDDIPNKPDSAYKDKGWAGWGDFLGTGVIAKSRRKYRSFEPAREYARSLGLKSSTQWHSFCKGEMPEKGALPKDIPVAVERVYEDQGWIGMSDWLGTGVVAPRLRQYKSYQQARRFTRQLGLKNFTEWRKYLKGEVSGKPDLPGDVPRDPYKVYKGTGWASWGDWLGTDR